MDNNNT
jgi:hypothetical protein